MRSTCLLLPVLALTVSSLAFPARGQAVEPSEFVVPAPCRPVPHQVVEADPRTAIVQLDRLVHQLCGDTAPASGGGRVHPALKLLHTALIDLECKSKRLRSEVRRGWQPVVLRSQISSMVSVSRRIERLTHNLSMHPETEEDLADTLDYIFALDAYFRSGA